MQSRMEKYQARDNKKYERTKKNTKLYEEVYDDLYKNATYENMEVIDTAKEINLNKLKEMIDDKYDSRQYRTYKNYDLDDVEDLDKHYIKEIPKRTYDINEIIKEAKSKRAFIEEAKEKQKYLEMAQRKINDYNEELENTIREEKELRELIHTMTMVKLDSDTSDALDLFSDLKGSENTIVAKPIDTSFEVDTEGLEDSFTDSISKTLVKADKTFYTGSNMFTKNDFEDFGDLIKSKGFSIKKLLIILLIMAIIALIIFFVINK